MIEWQRGNYSGGLQLAQETQVLDEGKELVVQLGLQGGQVESLLMNIEADLYQVKTEYSNAWRVQEAILRQTSAVLSPVDHAYALANIAFLDVVTGASADVVVRNLDAATRLFGNAQFPRGVSSSRVEYMRLFAAALDNNAELACYCLAKLADPTNSVHGNTESGRWAVVFLAFALHPLARSPVMVHRALRHIGDALVGQGAEKTGLNVLTVALEGFTQMDVHQSRAECMRTIGDVYARHGDLSRAREKWEAARPLFERSEQKKEVAKIDEKLQTLGVVQKLETIPKVQTTLQDFGMDSKGKRPVLIPDQ
ncbi:hypothetical protein B0H14DRAFT_2620107 [Mycena olivaceomarginata]|nr:hypothetical protein B0H14DRAFT_2620107 [Mycena olivaceomarginata]